MFFYHGSHGVSHGSLARTLVRPEMEEAAIEESSQFQPPKMCEEEVSLRECLKPKRTQYKD